MNFIKAQQELLKEWQSDNPQVAYGTYDDDHMAFTVNSTSGVIIPNFMFCLDPAKTKHRVYPFKGIKEKEDLEHQYFPTGITRALEIYNDVAVEFYDGKDDYKYVPQKQLKAFEDKKCINSYSGKPGLTPLYVSVPVFGIVGFILPINMTH